MAQLTKWRTKNNAMPEIHLKTALLAAIKPEGSTTIELSAATGIERAHAVRLLLALREDGLVGEPVKALGTHSWHRRPDAIPESECDNQDLINS